MPLPLWTVASTIPSLSESPTVLAQAAHARQVDDMEEQYSAAVAQVESLYEQRLGLEHRRLEAAEKC